MSSNLKDVLAAIEQLESNFDEYVQSFKKNTEDAIQNIGNSWKMLKTEQEEIKKLESNLEIQNSELTELKTKFGDFDSKLNDLKASKLELTKKSTELTTTLERLQNELNTPTMELNDVQSNLSVLNDKILAAEKEKSQLEQQKIDNEAREAQLKTLYTQDKMEELNKKMTYLKRNNFFTSFLIENSEQEIPEVDIIATIMDQGSCNLDELKKLLDVPPIMAVRTIKQLAVKSIINLDESTNIITLP
jgi:chromosome segregation ATPase